MEGQFGLTDMNAKYIFSASLFLSSPLFFMMSYTKDGNVLIETGKKEKALLSLVYDESSRLALQILMN